MGKLEVSKFNCDQVFSIRIPRTGRSVGARGQMDCVAGVRFKISTERMMSEGWRRLEVTWVIDDAGAASRVHAHSRRQGHRNQGQASRADARDRLRRRPLVSSCRPSSRASTRRRPACRAVPGQPACGQPLQPVARRPRLIAETELYTRPFQLAHETTHGTAVRTDLAEIPHLPIASAISHRDGMEILRHVHSNEKFATLNHGSPSWLEALLIKQPSLKAASVGRTAPPKDSRRRTYGLTAGRFLHDCLVRRGTRGISVRSVGGSRAGEVRIGRFLRNGKVTVEKVVEQAVRGTAGRVAGLHVLAIQDTTNFRDSGGGTGVVGHATIAVEAEAGALLGLAATQVIERSGGEKASKHAPLCDKQSRRWLDGMQESARLLEAGAAHVTAVADREGDIYEMFTCRPEGVDVLVRAAQDRVLADGGGKLFDGLEGRPEEEHAVDLPARPGQKARTARVSVRFGAVTLRRPRCRAAEPGAPKSQPVFLVEARELDPPAGVKPAHWRLLTSHRVETHDQARWITRLYRRRWTIEQLFRTVKTKGSDIEAVSMETAPFRVLCAMTLVAGVSCLQLVQDRDGESNRPLSDVFEEADRTALEAVSATLEGRTEKQKNPHPPGSLAFAAWICARLGGWTGYYGKPGPVVMLKGLYEFRNIQLGYNLALTGDV